MCVGSLVQNNGAAVIVKMSATNILLQSASAARAKNDAHERRFSPDIFFCSSLPDIDARARRRWQSYRQKKGGAIPVQVKILIGLGLDGLPVPAHRLVNSPAGFGKPS